MKCMQLNVCEHGKWITVGFISFQIRFTADLMLAVRLIHVFTYFTSSFVVCDHKNMFVYANLNLD